jgi:drug/metabolite transporter (DMT)-like permease
VLTSIYLVMPVGRLSLRHALLGGVTATVLWEITRHIQVWYFATLSQVNLVYGSLTTLGLLQYLSPTLQFLIGVWVFHEPFSPLRMIGFGLIWAALVLYSIDGWRRSRSTAPALVPSA